MSYLPDKKYVIFMIEIISATSPKRFMILSICMIFNTFIIFSIFMIVRRLGL